MTLLSARISCACQRRRRVRVSHAGAFYTCILGRISSTCTVCLRELIHKFQQWFYELEELPMIKVPRCLWFAPEEVVRDLTHLCRCITRCIQYHSKSKSPPSRETSLVSRETRLERNETSLERNKTCLVYCECTGSTNTSHSSISETSFVYKMSELYCID